LQAALRVPGNPEDTPGLTKARADSRAKEQLWRLSTDEGAQK
jgi:hypothetical protein